jgi:O-antigen/teichoic acid export membrane protein
MKPLPSYSPNDRLAASTRVGRNVSFRLMSQVLWALSNVVGLSLLGNYLHAEGYGNYAFYYALIPLIGALADLGIGIILTREMARDEAATPRLLGDALMLKGVFSGTILLVSLVTAWMFFPPAVAVLICLVSAAALIEIAQDPAIWLFRARERQDLEALLLMVSQVIWIAGLAAGAMFRLPLAYLLGVQTVAFLVRVVVGAWLASRETRPVFEWNAARMKGWIREGLPYGLAMFVVVFHGRVAVLLLQALSTSKDVAWFNVAYNLSQPFGFLSTALSMSAFPVISRYAAQSPEALKEALRKASKYQVLVSMPLMTGLLLLSDRLIPLLFHGEDFARAGAALRVTSLALVFIFLNLMCRYLLAALGRQQTYLMAVIAGLAVNAGTCLVLIPRFGFIGACVAYVAAEITIFAVCQTVLARHVDLIQLVRDASRPAAAAAGMGLVVFISRALPLGVVIALGAVTYPTLLLVFQVLSARELSILKGVYVSFRLPGSAYLSRAGQGT